MLYISRKIGENKFGVTDTDDNVEEICTRKELYEYILCLGLDIKGASVRTSLRSNWVDAEVYDIHSSGATAKLSLMYGVNLQLDNNGYIVKLALSENAKSCTIRLSDYANGVEAYSFKNALKLNNPDLSIRIILDNKLQYISPKLLQNVYVGKYYVFDISELTGNESAVSAIYKTSLPSTIYNYEPEAIFYAIKDTNIARRDFYALRQVVNLNLDEPYDLEAFIVNIKEANKRLEKVLLKEFRSLAKCEFYYNYTFLKRDDLKSCRASIFSSKMPARKTRVCVANPNMYTKSYVLDRKVAVELLNDLGRICTVNSSCLGRLAHYIQYIDMSDAITDIYLGIIQRYLTWIFDEYKEYIRG